MGAGFRLYAIRLQTQQYNSLDRNSEKLRPLSLRESTSPRRSCLPLRSSRSSDPEFLLRTPPCHSLVKTARPHSPAFSLVETALAIGVIAFAFVGLLALLPAGLNNFRGAVDTSVSAQIFQRVVTDAEQADFDLLTGTATSGKGEFYVLPTRFFDDQGSEVVPRIAGRPSPFEGQQIVYHVHVRGSRPGPDALSTGGATPFTSLPAGPRTRRFSPRDSTILTIQIAHHPGAATLPLDPQMLLTRPKSGGGPIAVVTYSAVITRNGFARKVAQ